MAILSCFKCRTAISIDKLMALELPISRENEYGHLADAVKVTVVDSDSFVLYVCVGRSDDGYYYGVDYATESGGGCGGAWRERKRRCKGKLQALRRGIKEALSSYWITRHEGNAGKLERALKELKRYEYVQLTLF